MSCLFDDDDAPEVCCVCGRPAVTCYADDESNPSCGSPRCELQMQVAIDCHADAGDR